MMTSAREDPSIAVGHVIDDRYVVESVLAEGGMGVVVLAHHKVVHHRVALKIILRSLMSNPEMLARFEREARVTNEIDHSGFVRTLDYGLDRGRPYFVMEYLSGLTVGELVRRDGPMPIRRTVEALQQVADALQAAHEYGVIHRDVKPENVFLCEDGEVKLLDLGVAKYVAGKTLATRTGLLLGTPHTMSPEQCRGATIDARSDIYALAVTAYYMCTGRFPFAGPATDIMRAHLQKEPPRLDDAVSPGLSELIARNLAKDPADRMQSMREVARSLAAIARSLRGSHEDVRTLGRERQTPLHGERMTRERRSRSDRRGGAWISISVAALLLVGGTFALWLHDRPATVSKREVVTAPVPPVTATAQGRLAIVTDPRDAQVLVDGEARGIGNVVVQAPLGRRLRVEALRTGYQPLKRELTVDKESLATLKLEKLRRPALRGMVEVPDSWAAVYVDGRLLGEAPLGGLSLPPGAHRFVLVDAGRGFPEGSPLERTVIVRPGHTATISLASRDE
jgi:eukaryotic-like serine/threonine-protein kinase